MTPLMLAARHGAVPVLRELPRAARTATTEQEAWQQDCGSGDGSGGSSGSSGSCGSGSDGSLRIHSVVNAVAGHGFTALHHTAECRYHAAGAAAARLLIDAGADTEVGSLGVGTPLTLAASGENLAIVCVLLEAGADPRAFSTPTARSSLPPPTRRPRSSRRCLTQERTHAPASAEDPAR